MASRCSGSNLSTLAGGVVSSTGFIVWRCIRKSKQEKESRLPRGRQASVGRCRAPTVTGSGWRLQPGRLMRLMFACWPFMPRRINDGEKVFEASVVGSLS
jgi:hypothetical protein